MTPKKQPTNFDLASDIKELKAMVTPLIADVKSLQSWRQGIDIGKAAVEEYKEQEERDRQTKLNDELKSKAIKILVQLAPLLTALGVILYAYAKKN